MGSCDGMQYSTSGLIRLLGRAWQGRYVLADIVMSFPLFAVVFKKGVAQFRKALDFAGVFYWLCRIGVAVKYNLWFAIERFFESEANRE